MEDTNQNGQNASEKKNDAPVDLTALDGLTLGTAWTDAGRQSAPRSDRDDRNDRPYPRRENGDRNSSGPGRGATFGAGRPPSRPFGKPFNKDGRDNRRGDDRRDNRGAPAPEQPKLKVSFYPEEAPFKALAKAIKASNRTYELFEITRLILEKPERTIATVTAPAGADGKTPPLYQSIADGALFLNEKDALQHACGASLEKFFKIEEVEVDPPKGNFMVVHRCGITGKLIAPPNYHRYSQMLAEHQAKNLPNMSLPAIQAKIESVKEPEAIAQWIEGMKKITRYTLLTPPEGEQPSVFDGADAASAHLALNFKATLVKSVSQARLTAKEIEALPNGDLKRSIELSRALQTKFPLETANNLRGRLRRMGFILYKRGQQNISYLTAVKRKFRIIGQTFAPEVQRVLEFIEKNPNISDIELPKRMLGVEIKKQDTASNTASSAAKGSSTAEPTIETPVENQIDQTAPASTTANNLSPEEDAALRSLRQTLQWLIEGGYVVHFGNGKLFVPPARPAEEVKKIEKEDEKESGAEVSESIEESTSPKPETKAEVTVEVKAEEKKDETPNA